MSNASALFRSLLIYGLCLPLAVVLGYLLANPLTVGTLTVVLVIAFVLSIPLLLRWHHIWLIATWNMSAVLFFLPGHPPLWTGLAAVSFAISILQYTLNRRMKFLSAPTLVWPLLFLVAVVLITARLTGGFGARVLGSSTYGAKRYFFIFAAVIGYFALINRRIPPHRVGLYVALFFLGSATMAIGNLPGRISSAFNFIFVLFPVMSLTPFTSANSVVGPLEEVTRINGLGFLGLGVFCAMLARYGVRGVLDMKKPWRVAVFCFFVLVCMAGGFRSFVALLLMTFALLFYLEGLHRTRLLLPVLLVSLCGGGLVILFASRMPFAVQRSLTFVPYIQLDPLARLSAESSTEWRLQMWRDVIPQIPHYLLVGKGYAFSAREHRQLGGSLEGTELVGNYHNGPLSVILPFGIFGSIAFIWLLIAGARVVYQNYQYGDPAFHNVNTFLFAFFVVKIVFFFTVFGDLHSDLAMFLGLLGLSISINGGVAKPVVVEQPKIVFNRFKLHPSARRPVGA